MGQSGDSAAATSVCLSSDESRLLIGADNDLCYQLDLQRLLRRDAVTARIQLSDIPDVQQYAAFVLGVALLLLPVSECWLVGW
jgi:hypothetical protein